jgi:hypothetical protein
MASKLSLTYSLKKVGCCGKDTDHFKLRSLASTTDSGGAVTREDLAKLFIANNLVEENVLAGTCAIHNTQIHLSNVITSLLGLGEIGKNNLMQMLHSVYQLQSAMNPKEWWLAVHSGVEAAKQRIKNGPPKQPYPKADDLYCIL